jgi:hypothetical protein
LGSKSLDLLNEVYDLRQALKIGPSTEYGVHVPPDVDALFQAQNVTIGASGKTPGSQNACAGKRAHGRASDKSRPKSFSLHPRPSQRVSLIGAFSED